MHVVAFAPSTRAVVQDAGGVRLDGFPMTSAHVDSFPKQITIPLVLAVYTEGGSDYDPRRYIVARSPHGERLNVLECIWHWPDNPGVPVKFRVFVHHLPLVVHSAGVYTIGLYDEPRRDRNRPSIPSSCGQVQPADAASLTAPDGCDTRQTHIRLTTPPDAVAACGTARGADLRGRRGPMRGEPSTKSLVGADDGKTKPLRPFFADVHDADLR